MTDLIISADGHGVYAQKFCNLDHFLSYDYFSEINADFEDGARSGDGGHDWPQKAPAM